MKFLEFSLCFYNSCDNRQLITSIITYIALEKWKKECNILKLFWNEVLVFRKLKLLNCLVDSILIFTLQKRDTLYCLDLLLHTRLMKGWEVEDFTLLSFQLFNLLIADIVVPAT